GAGAVAGPERLVEEQREHEPEDDRGADGGADEDEGIAKDEAEDRVGERLAVVVEADEELLGGDEVPLVEGPVEVVDQRPEGKEREEDKVGREERHEQQPLAQLAAASPTDQSSCSQTLPPPERSAGLRRRS